MKSWKDEKISVFKHFSAAPQTVTIGDWLRICINGSRYSDTVLEYRRTHDKSLKKTLPLATFGAVMKNGRKLQNVVRRTGWVAIDIDGDDNPHITDWPALRSSLGGIDYIAFSSLSASGNGVWALMKVAEPKHQSEHFCQILEDFKNADIQLDSSKGRNPNDARFYSYDPDAYVAEQFDVYDRLPIKKVTFKKLKKRKKTSSPNTKHHTYNTSTKVKNKLAKISARGINIAPDYNTYLMIGFAFADEFGENGRQYFHQAVRYSPKYNREKADKQFTECLRVNNGNVSIGTFFYYCNQFNI